MRFSAPNRPTIADMPERFLEKPPETYTSLPFGGGALDRARAGPRRPRRR
jgi:hypothetical protein